MTAYLGGLRRYFDFKGQSSRSQLWMYWAILIPTCIVALLDPIAGDYLLEVLWNSGWIPLLLLVPFAGTIMAANNFCMPSASTAKSEPSFSKPKSIPVAARPAPAPREVPAADGSDIHLDALEKLAMLRSRGVVDESEFQHLKAKLIAGMRMAS